jgi:hypothetical protein
MTSKEYKKKFRRNGRLRRVIITCKACGRRRKIDAADKTIYTPEFRANYICVFCR